MQQMEPCEPVHRGATACGAGYGREEGTMGGAGRVLQTVLPLAILARADEVIE